MPVTFRKVRLVMGLVDQNASDKSLVVPGSAAVYKADKITLATLYSDEDGTALANPVPTGVADGAPGLDAVGNLVIYVDIAQDYFVLLNGHYEPIPSVGINGSDFSDHVNVIADPHGDRAWATSQFISKTNPSALTGIAGNAGLIRF